MPFYFFGGGFLYQIDHRKKGYPYSNLSNGGPRRGHRRNPEGTSSATSAPTTRRVSATRVTSAPLRMDLRNCGLARRVVRFAWFWTKLSHLSNANRPEMPFWFLPFWSIRGHDSDGKPSEIFYVRVLRAKPATGCDAKETRPLRCDSAVMGMTHTVDGRNPFRAA